MTRNHGYPERPDLRNKFRKRNYNQTMNVPNAGKYWSKAEDDAVLARLVTDRMLSEQIGRSMQAIQNRRLRLIKMEDANV